MRDTYTNGDPLALGRRMWPPVRFDPKQKDIIYGIRYAKETHVVAANQMGKDFVAGFIALTFFIRPQMYFPDSYVWEIERQRTPKRNPHTVRVVTTSVNDNHLDVLWGEIGSFWSSCEMDLNKDFVINSKEIRRRDEMHLTSANAKNYLVGRVSSEAKDMQGLAGHHAAYTLVIGDEASGLSDNAYDKVQGWAKRHLYFGNPHQCQNFWRRAVEAGDLLEAT